MRRWGFRLLGLALTATSLSLTNLAWADALPKQLAPEQVLESAQVQAQSQAQPQAQPSPKTKGQSNQSQISQVESPSLNLAELKLKNSEHLKQSVEKKTLILDQLPAEKVDSKSVKSDSQSKAAKVQTAPIFTTESLKEASPPDFVSSPPKLRFVKVQLQDATRNEACQAGAEFAIVVNFGLETVELSDLVLQSGKIGEEQASYTKTLAKMALPAGKSLVIYNPYFSKGGSGCPANTAAQAWLSSQDYVQAPRSLKSGYMQADGWLGLALKTQPKIKIDRLDLSLLKTDLGHDTLVAQTDEHGTPLFDDNGRLSLRSVQVHRPEQHLLNYGSLIKFLPAPEAPKNICKGIILSEISLNVPENKQFIEIHNTNNIAVSLAACRLWTSWSGQSEYVFDDIEIQKSESLAIFLKDTKLQVLKTAAGRIELRNEINQVVDKLIYQAQIPNSSWGKIGDEFVISFAPSPNLPNVDLPELICQPNYVFNFSAGICQKKPVEQNVDDDINEADIICKVGYEVGFTGTCVKKCGVGYERNPDTNRCRKIVLELETSLLPCPIGYERNPLTKRCRKIGILTQAVLLPCPVGYERNPDTNRCRKITNQQDCDDGYEVGFTGTCVKKCAEGYERNPETNHCRNLIAQASQLDVDSTLSKIDTAKRADTFTVSLKWWQLVILIASIATLVIFRERATIKRLLKRIK